ncbi:MAG: hypothetical protein ABT00_11665 [Bordetella sp. SCN 68-11]|nr:MAG: hypothetical protein ABT00_11665 [Bordetella sp. SCN 68-11]
MVKEPVNRGREQQPVVGIQAYFRSLVIPPCDRMRCDQSRGNAAVRNGTSLLPDRQHFISKLPLPQPSLDELLTSGRTQISLRILSIYLGRSGSQQNRVDGIACNASPAIRLLASLDLVPRKWWQFAAYPCRSSDERLNGGHIGE